MDVLNIALRLAQYASILSLFGLAGFAIYAPRAAAFLPRGRGILALAFVGLSASTAAIFVLAVTMTGDVAGATDPSVLLSIISDTAVGHAWTVRLVALAAAIGVARIRNPFPLLVASGLAAATLAWGGHAVSDTGLFGLAHLSADVIHILAAGIWVGALVAFLRLVMLVEESAGATASALAAFSGVGSAVVAILIATGLVNALHMVEWRPLPVLTTSPWGWLLMAKLGLFGAMLGLAAANRFLLTPRLETEISNGVGGRLTDLRRSLMLETSLAFGVVALVSVLGALAPPTAV